MNKTSISRKIVIIILLIFTCINIFRIQSLSKQNNIGIDLRTIFLGSELWQKNLNPYSDSLLKSQWGKSMPDEVKSHKVEPGLPSIPLLYPPTALVFFAPFTAFNWQNAVWLYFVFEIFSLVLIVFFSLKILENYQLKQSTLFIIIAIFSFKAVMPSFWVCQPTWPTLAMLFGAWYFLIIKKIHWAGILCGLAFIKFTLAVPVFIFLFLIAGKSKSKFLFYAVIPQLVLILIYLLHTDLMSVKIQMNSWMEVANQYRNYVFEVYRPEYPYTYELTTITETRVIFPKFGNELFMLIVFVSMVLSFLNRKRLKDNIPELFILCVVTFLCISHHLYYDILMLLPGLFFIQKLRGFQLVCALLILVSFLFPFTAILNYIGHPSVLQWLQFSNSIGCLLLLLLIWWRFGMRFMEK